MHKSISQLNYEDKNYHLLSKSKDVRVYRFNSTKAMIKKEKEEQYRGQAVLRSYTVIFHAMSRGCVNQPRSFGHGHMIGR